MSMADHPSGLMYDDIASKLVESIYVTSDMDGQRRAVLRALELRPGESVLDIGSGPGYLTLEIAGAVGPTGQVLGLDVSEPMLTLARARAARSSNSSRVTFLRGDPTHLPVPDSVFDVGIATQVYEYVTDVSTALAELYRVLRPGGRALVLDTDWDSLVWHSCDRERMERVLAAWAEHVPNPRLPRRLAPLLRTAGFGVETRGVIPLFNPELTIDAYSYGLTDLIAAVVPGRRGLTASDVTAWVEDVRDCGATGDYFFSLNRYLFLVQKPTTGTWSPRSEHRIEDSNRGRRFSVASLGTSLPPISRPA